MQNNKKLITQPQSISSNDLTARNKKYMLWKNREKPAKYDMSSQRVNTSEQSTSVQNSRENKSVLQVQSKLNKPVDRTEKNDSASISSTNNTEREIAETLHLLRKEISHWKAHESSKSGMEDSKGLIISSDEQIYKKNYDETNNQQDGIQALCLELDKIRTSGSTTISTFRHQCDSERFKDDEDYFKHLVLPTKSIIQQESVEREDFSKATLPMTEYSYINKPTIIEDTNQNIFLSEKISQKNLSLSPQTIQVLDNIETLIQNAQKQLSEINDNILFYKKNPEMPNAQPTIDEDLLRIRQIVAIKFHEASNQLKLCKDHTKFSASIPQIQEENIVKAPRLLKLMTMLPEKCNSNIRDDECCKNISHCLRRKMAHYSHIPHTCDKIKTESHEKKATQTDERENINESSTFQIQNGPKVIVKRSLQVQNVDRFHVSPETSYQEPKNVGVYSFQHNTLSEQTEFSEKKFINENDKSQISKKESFDKNQIFRKSVVLKSSDDSRRKVSLKRSSEMVSDKITKTNNFSEINIDDDSDQHIIDDELIAESLTSKESTVHLKVSPKECNIENENSKTEKFPKDNEKRQIPSCHIGNLPKNQPSIISNEKVNFEYKDILKGAQSNSLVPKLSSIKLDKSSNESNAIIDHISLEKLSVFDLDTAIKRNNEIIKNVIQSTDVFLKSISPKFEIKNNDNDNKYDNQKVNSNAEMVSLQNFKSPAQQLESIKFPLVENFPKIYFSEKENEFIPGDANKTDFISSSPDKFSKFISPKSDINDQETATNSQSINLSSISLSLMSSTKNMIFQPSLPSIVTKSLSKDLSKDETLNDLKDLSIEIFSDKKETLINFQRQINSTSDPKETEENKQLNQNILTHDDLNNDHSERKESVIFPRSFKDSPKIETNANIMLSSKISLQSSNSHKEENKNKYSDVDIFSQIFKSLKNSSVIMKKLLTCLCRETDAVIENEIINIFREISVNDTIINQFLVILQNRDKNSQFLTFIKDLGSHLNFIDKENIECETIRRQFIEFLDKSKIKVLDSHTIRNSSPNASSKIENKNNNSLQTKLDFDVSAKDKNVIYSDCKLVVAQEKNDSLKLQEKINIFDKVDKDFSLQKLTQKIFVDKCKNYEIQDLKKEADDQQYKEINNSTELKTEKLNSKQIKLNSSTKIKSTCNSEYSGVESSKGIDYSQNFTESSTSKLCNTLESLVSLKLSDSFMFKGKDSSNKEICAERNVELDIQQKLNYLLNMEKHIAQSIEESLKTESKESNFQCKLKRKSLIRGETFIIKKSDLGHKEKSIPVVCSDLNILNNSQEGSKLKTPLVISERRKKIDELSSETYSEGEINCPSSCSYSLGEIRGSQGENISLKKTSNKTCSTWRIKNKNQSSCSSTILSNSVTRSLGEFH
ncbi:uncharacterized protein LOC127278579 [Leptopilina boulardi]|uniref:uncharacterized protein LOC127278579 n=1 Tax=Leptopilina boulardi TaxID=63433 RepID=UPI0021F50476|nr:uncharacterized protein LOC127278579 [Leptopilina boulardi]